jgi:hypothetical protein
MKIVAWCIAIYATTLAFTCADGATCQELALPHLRGRPFDLSVRRGDSIVPAPAELLRLARTYPAFPDKGTIVNGRRITLMTERDHYRIGESVRVVHVLEAVAP